MTCTEFKQWFQDHESDQMSHEIRQHLTTCDGCRQIYELDRILETKLKNNFEQCDVPQRLLERLEQNKSGNNLWLVQPYVLRRVIAPMLAIAALFVVFLFPFSSENSSFASMDILGELAIHDHLSHGTKGCSISGINDIGSWALKELGYRVVLPETPEGSELLVVSKCRLGDCETVHLIYQHGENQFSIFVFPKKEAAFNLAAGISYSLDYENHQVRFWRTGDQIQVMVL